MSGYEYPPPTNINYFNPVYYTPTAGGGGTTVNTANLLQYPTAQGSENFPAGLQTSNDIIFSSTNGDARALQNVSSITFVDMSGAITGSDATGSIVQSVDAMTITTTAPSIALDAQTTNVNALTFGDGTTQNTAYMPTTTPDLVTQPNTWLDLQTFDQGIKFANGTIQTTAPTAGVNYTTQANTWTQQQTFNVLPSCTSTAAPTSQNLTTQLYVNSNYLTSKYYGIAQYNVYSTATQLTAPTFYFGPSSFWGTGGNSYIVSFRIYVSYQYDYYNNTAAQISNNATFMMDVFPENLVANQNNGPPYTNQILINQLNGVSSSQSTYYYTTSARNSAGNPIAPVGRPTWCSSVIQTSGNTSNNLDSLLFAFSPNFSASNIALSFAFTNPNPGSFFSINFVVERVYNMLAFNGGSVTTSGFSYATF